MRNQKGWSTYTFEYSYIKRWGVRPLQWFRWCRGRGQGWRNDKWAFFASLVAFASLSLSCSTGCNDICCDRSTMTLRWSAFWLFWRQCSCQITRVCKNEGKLGSIRHIPKQTNELDPPLYYSLKNPIPHLNQYRCLLKHTNSPLRHCALYHLSWDGHLRGRGSQDEVVF